MKSIENTKGRCPVCGMPCPLTEGGRLKRHTALVIPVSGPNGALNRRRCKGTGRLPTEADHAETRNQ